MSGLGRRFDPSEISPDGDASPSTADIAQAMLAARELEALTARDSAGPTVGFEDRVMAMIGAEPVPRLLVRPRRAVRGGLPIAFLASVRDAWRLATGGGRPFAVRAQAFAFVLLVVLATGSITTVFAVGAASFLTSGPTPTPSVSTTTVSPTPSGLPSPSTSPSPANSETAQPTNSVAPGIAAPTDTTEPGDTAEPTDTHEPDATPKAKTPKPTKTPRATETAEPDETAEPTGTDHDGGGDDGGGGGGGDGGGEGRGGDGHGGDDSGGD
jgi:uncharacterized membrane protein YgcG